MREIKFRLWDKINNTMIRVARIDIADGTAYTHLFSSTPLDYWNACTLEQYTGLHDKNGKEIYEGDIANINQEDEECIFVVEWEEDTARFIMSCDTFIVDFDNYYGKDIEVIGNIYENPNLINGGKTNE